LVEALRSAVLEGAAHGFMTRRGGISTGAVAGLQCGLGAGDDEDAVRANRALAVAAVAPGGTLVTPYQVHSPDVAVATDPWAWEDRPRADAVVTDRPGLLLGIVTADCAPVLFADVEAGVVGAAHAGWRGAHGGVLENTLAAMESLGARRERIAAAIGPTIAQPSYEVDQGFRDQFTCGDARCFTPGREGHWQFDLPAYCAKRLAQAGVDRIDDLARDTYAEPDRFYSFRRATHLGEPNYGRQLSLIALA
jgi:polyphenol oxidase